MSYELVEQSTRLSGSGAPFAGISPNDHFGWEKEESRTESAALRDRLFELQRRHAADASRGLILIVQGIDASGKDGVVRRVFSGVNPQGITVTSYKAPTELERRHDYLWRIHANVPARGQIAIWNRSHLEDVVTAGLLGLIDDAQVIRRCEHLVSFEQMLFDEGIDILKCFLFISPEEQRERLQDRIANPQDRWKFNPADLQTREKWHELHDRYERALLSTSSLNAPWFVVPADRKWVRDRVILTLLVGLLERNDPQYPQADIDWDAVVVPEVAGR